jgi:hypothetical protein
MPQFDRFDEDRFERRPGRDWDLGFDQPAAPQATPAAPTDAPAPTDFGTFEMPEYGGSSSPMYRFGQVPEFDAPEFDAPSFEDAQQEPGYQFRLDAGRQALERSAAARGVLRTGGSLKDLLEYGQNFGAQEYSNVFNRALQGYQNQFGAEQARALAEFQRQMELYNAQTQNAQWQEMLASGFLNDPAPTFPGSY